MLRRSQDRLRSLAEPLNCDQLRLQSFAKEWSIARVWSHLGSQSQIFRMMLDASLGLAEFPASESFPPDLGCMERENAGATAADALPMAEAIVQQFEGLD